MDLVETELCDYLQVRHIKLDPVPVDSGSSSSPPAKTGGKQATGETHIPSKFYKVDWIYR